MNEPIEQARCVMINAERVGHADAQAVVQPLMQRCVLDAYDRGWTDCLAALAALIPQLDKLDPLMLIEALTRAESPPHEADE